MNDLMIQKNAMDWLKDTLQRFSEIQSFDDLERQFLRNTALSGTTYAGYMSSFRQAYDYFHGLLPLQWTAAHVEQFYDHVLAKNSPATAYQRMYGIKKICQQIKQQAPWWTTPFELMTPQTLKKITRPPVGQKKSAMYQAEVDGMLKHLAKDHTPKGRQNMAIVMTLLRTGLRAAELCAVNWSDIDYDTDKRVYRLRGIGKGSKPFEMDLGNDAVLAIKAAYLRKNQIMPRTDTPVFLSLANYKGKTPARLSKVVMHNRLAAIGQILKEQGIIRGNLEFSAHLFRRTSITLLYGKGFKIADLQKFSRHASVNTLIDHYVDSSESAAPMLDEILAEAAC